MVEKQTSCVVEIPIEAGFGALVQVRTPDGQLLQFPVPDGLDSTQRYVCMEYSVFEAK